MICSTFRYQSKYLEASGIRLARNLHCLFANLRKTDRRIDTTKFTLFCFAHFRKNWATIKPQKHPVQENPIKNFSKNSSHCRFFFSKNAFENHVMKAGTVPLDKATLDIASALPIATSTLLTEASRYIQWALYSKNHKKGLVLNCYSPAVSILSEVK